jgi:hypothetical protein
MSTPAPQDNASFNASGQIGARIGIAGSAGGVNDNAGVFRTDVGGIVIQIIREGDPAPDGVGNFETFQPVTMNDSGQVAINTSLTNAGNTVVGIFLGDGVGPLAQIARAGDPIPDGTADFLEFDDPAVNNAGQVLFGAALGTIDTTDGLYLYDGTGPLTQIARIGDPTPDGAATFTNFNSRPSLNDSLGLVNVIREGDAFLDSTILRLNFGEQIREDEYSGFNDLGEVAFAYTLVNGDSGIAIWTVPEPATGVLLLPGLMLFTRRARHRHRMQHPTNRRTFCQMAQAKGVGPWELDR